MSFRAYLMKQRYFPSFSFSAEFNCYVDTYKKRVKATEYLVWAYISKFAYNYCLKSP